MKNKINKLNIDNTNLKNELDKANRIILNFPQQENNNTNINNLNSIIQIKDKEIYDLKLQLQNNSNIKKFVNFDDIIFINFLLGQEINCGIKCLKTDTFAEVEEKLYQKYEEYRETNNNFTTKGKIILRFKKIFENNIQDGDKIELINI